MDLSTQPEIRVEGSAWIFLAVLILLLPLSWVLSALTAALIHELSHILMLKLLCVPIFGIRVGARGAVLSTGAMTNQQELLCALAGPVGSFSVLILIRLFPRLALCALVQGLYNLLPFYPMDGGRAVRSGILLLLGKRPCKRKKVGVQ